MTEEHSEIEHYGDEAIASYDAKVPLFLKLTYFILPFWGALCFYLYWNGSRGWLDRGYWKQLQEVSQTAYPYNDKSLIKESR